MNEKIIDRLEVVETMDAELKNELEKVNWHLSYGSVRVQVRAGKPTLIIVERTIKLD